MAGADGGFAIAGAASRQVKQLPIDDRSLPLARITPWQLTRHPPPFKLRYFVGKGAPPVRRILDVGCGNHSASVTKRWFPAASYVGVDIGDYNNSHDDYALMERFVKADLDRDSLGVLEDESFDLIIMAHVIEHLHHGEEAVSNLARKLRPGGHMYIECPSERSRRFPSAYHTLNFYDDPTHVRIYDLKGVCTAAGLRVVRGGIRHDWPRAIQGVTVRIPAHIRCFLQHRQLFGPYLWDLLGFAKYAVAMRP